MSNLKHTQGKWYQDWNENNSPSTCIVKSLAQDGEKQSICKIYTNEQDMYNAILLASAPTLLQTLIENQKVISRAINSTPSGELRNELTEMNIKTLLAIDLATK